MKKVKIKKLTKKELQKLRGGVKTAGRRAAGSVWYDLCGGCSGASAAKVGPAKPGVKPIISPRPAPKRKK